MELTGRDWSTAWLRPPSLGFQIYAMEVCAGRRERGRLLFKGLGRAVARGGGKRAEQGGGGGEIRVGPAWRV